jgi:hypothetical protein
MPRFKLQTWLVALGFRDLGTMNAAAWLVHIGLLRRPFVCHDVDFVNAGDATWQVEL